MGALEQRRAGALGVAGEGLVELGPCQGEPVGREAGDVGPAQLVCAAVRDEAQPGVTDRAGKLDAEALELADGPRRQAVAAHLVARELRPFEEQDVETRARAPGGGGRARGAPADDDHVSDGVGRAAQADRAGTAHARRVPRCSATTPPVRLR